MPHHPSTTARRSSSDHLLPALSRIAAAAVAGAVRAWVSWLLNHHV
ncbi:hypothetical protein OG252_51575 [Streptomyces sp. NBC_01352]|nr:hypothetical protein [Streptomyces sp. NBC_01352]